MKHPPVFVFVFVVKADVALSLGEELIVDSNVTFWCAAHEDLALTFFHFADIVVVNLAVVRSTENLHSESLVRSIVIEAFRQKINDDVGLANVDEHIVPQYDAASQRHLDVVCRLWPQTLEHDGVVALRVHFLENSEAYTQILYVVSLAALVRCYRVRSHLLPTDTGVEPDLEVSAAMLLRGVAVARWYHEVVDDDNLAASVLTV